MVHRLNYIRLDMAGFKHYMDEVKISRQQEVCYFSIILVVGDVVMPSKVGKI